VQTQADGRARIAMADGSTVVVRPNSTIIIRDNVSEDGGRRSNVRVVVDSGQMLVRTQEQTEGAKELSRDAQDTKHNRQPDAGKLWCQP
jgi:hypothetical protein